MKFRAAHVIHNIDLPRYEALYFDESFAEALCQALQLRRQLITRNVNSQALHRAVLVGPQRDIPKPVAKILGAARLEYTEYIDYDMGTYAGRWRTAASVIADKVASAGTFHFEARGADVLRVVEGSVDIKIFGVGGLVERFIVNDVQQSYAAAADFTNRYLQDPGAAAGFLAQ